MLPELPPVPLEVNPRALQAIDTSNILFTQEKRAKSSRRVNRQHICIENYTRKWEQNEIGSSDNPGPWGNNKELPQLAVSNIKYHRNIDSIVMSSSWTTSS